MKGEIRTRCALDKFAANHQLLSGGGGISVFAFRRRRNYNGRGATLLRRGSLAVVTSDVLRKNRARGVGAHLRIMRDATHRDLHFGARSIVTVHICSPRALSPCFFFRLHFLFSSYRLLSLVRSNIFFIKI